MNLVVYDLKSRTNDLVCVCALNGKCFEQNELTYDGRSALLTIILVAGLRSTENVSVYLNARNIQ